MRFPALTLALSAAAVFGAGGAQAQAAPMSGAVAPQDNSQQSTSAPENQPSLQQVNPNQGPAPNYQALPRSANRPIGSSMTDGLVVDYETLVARFKSARTLNELNDDQRLIRYLPPDQQADATREYAAQRVRVQKTNGQ